MIYPQREAEPTVVAEDDGGVPSAIGDRLPWRPADTPLALVGGDPSLTDAILARSHYAAVDQVDGPITILAITLWPTVEPATARLDFGPRAERRVIRIVTARLQSRADADRAAVGQLVRAIRVGDVFLVLGLAGPVARWARLVDVTRAGRLAAKAALFSTVAPAPFEAGAPAYGLAPDQVRRDPDSAPSTDVADETAPSGPVAYPAV